MRSAWISFLRYILNPDGPKSKDPEIQQAILGQMNSGEEYTVGDLISKISESREIQSFEVARNISVLELKGQIKLRDNELPNSLVSYLESPYGTWFWAVVGTMFLSFVLIYLLPQVGAVVYLRYAFGIAFIAFLPGYAVTESLYPLESDLTVLERTALSLGLSLTVVPLVAILFYYSHIPIRLDTMFLSLSVLGILLSLLGARKKMQSLPVQAKIGANKK